MKYPSRKMKMKKFRFKMNDAIRTTKGKRDWRDYSKYWAKTPEHRAELKAMYDAEIDKQRDAMSYAVGDAIDAINKMAELVFIASFYRDTLLEQTDYAQWARQFEKMIRKIRKLYGPMF